MYNEAAVSGTGGDPRTNKIDRGLPTLDVVRGNAAVVTTGESCLGYIPSDGGVNHS